MVARKGQNTELQIKQEDKRKFNNYINKKRKVQTIVLVNIRMSVKLRRKCL